MTRRNLPTILTTILLSLSYYYCGATTDSTQLLVPVKPLADNSLESSIQTMTLALVPQQAMPDSAIRITTENLSDILNSKGTITTVGDAKYIVLPPLHLLSSQQIEQQQQEVMTSPRTVAINGEHAFKVLVENLPHPRPHPKPNTNNATDADDAQGNSTSSNNNEHTHFSPFDFIKTAVDQQKDQQYSTPLLDQFVIVFTVAGMSLLVGLISFRKQRKWKIKKSFRQEGSPLVPPHGKNPFYSNSYTYSNDKGSHSKNKNGGVLANLTRRLKRFPFSGVSTGETTGMATTVGDVFYEPSLISSSSAATGPYGYDTFSTVSGYGPQFSYAGWNGDLEKFDV